MPKSQTQHIAGPAGQLEMHITQPDAAIRGTAVLCHPHPLYGGSMHDQVLDICAQSLLPLGITIARFNFRGVGASAGISGRASDAEKQQQTYSPPEVGDLYAVIDELAGNKGATAPILIGYSFGAHVLWQALGDLVGRDMRPAKAILVAPPTSAMTFREQTPPAGVDLHAIWCSDDNYVDSGWFADQPAVTTNSISGGDHFFSNQGHALSSALRDSLVNDHR
jgi:alpha/beta superfamily hydrolase